MSGKVYHKWPETERKQLKLSNLLPGDKEKLKDTIRSFLIENAEAYGINRGDFSVMLTDITIDVATAKKRG